MLIIHTFQLPDCQYLQSSGWLCTCEGNTCFYHPEGSVFFPFKQIHRQKSYSALLPPYSRLLSPCLFYIFASFETKTIFTSRLEPRHILQSNLCRSLCNFQAGMSEASSACLKVNETSALPELIFFITRTPVFTAAHILLHGNCVSL